MPRRSEMRKKAKEQAASDDGKSMASERMGNVDEEAESDMEAGASRRPSGKPRSHVSMVCVQFMHSCMHELN